MKAISLFLENPDSVSTNAAPSGLLLKSLLIVKIGMIPGRGGSDITGTVRYLSILL
jgi:hypothetical protein